MWYRAEVNELTSLVAWTGHRCGTPAPGHELSGVECLNTKWTFWVKPPGHKIIFSNESLFSLKFSNQFFNSSASLSMLKCFYDLPATSGWGLAYFPCLHFIITSLFLTFFGSYCSFKLKDQWNSLQDYKVNLHTCTEILLSKTLECFLWLSQTSRHYWGCDQCSSCLTLQASNFPQLSLGVRLILNKANSPFP